MPVTLNYNRINLTGTINHKLARDFNDKFEECLSYPFSVIELHISSPGGEVSACEHICNTLQLSYKPVDIYIHNGRKQKQYPGVASGASVISQFCRKKIMDRDATFLIHHSRSGRKVHKDPEDIYFWMERTGLDYETIRGLLLDEPQMSAETAQNLGFVDEINYNVSLSLP
jgi:ATP-dependent protease ClpP protease subunit